MSGKKPKTIKIIILVVLILIVGCSITMYVKYKDMVRTFQKTTVNDINIKKVKDGVYTGQFEKFLILVELKVTVKNHKITGIEIVNQRAGKGYEATEITDKVVKAQSLKVDSVTGATISSVAILKAIERALTETK